MSVCDGCGVGNGWHGDDCPYVPKSTGPREEPKAYVATAAELAIEARQEARRRTSAAIHAAAARLGVPLELPAISFACAARLGEAPDNFTMRLGISDLRLRHEEVTIGEDILEAPLLMTCVPRLAAPRPPCRPCVGSDARAVGDRMRQRRRLPWTGTHAWKRATC